MDFLVSQAWLAEHLNSPDLVVIDCTNFAAWSDEGQVYRTTSGRGHWQDNHIPGSRHADFSEPGFTGVASRFRNTLPDPAAFAQAMGRLGVHENSRVVLYDDGASLWATRVWWMLRWIGLDRAAVLDGGWVGWEDAGGAVCNTPQSFEVTTLAHRPRSGMFVEKQDVEAIIGNPDVVLIDALSEGQFNGRETELGLKGHIPGAINIPGAGLVDRINERFLPDAQLTPLFSEDRAKRTIIYCGSGVAAASVAFTMVRLGHSDVSIYMPGLQEWALDPSAPVNNR